MRAFPLLLMALCLLAPAWAETIPLPAGSPVASVEIPKEWTPRVSGKGVEAVSEDGSVYLAIGHVTQDEVSELLDNAFTYLATHGVEVDKESVSQEDLKLNGMEVVDVTWNGTDAGDVCVGKLDLFGISETDGLMMLYWATPEAILSNAERLAGIIDSIQPLASTPAP